LDFGTIQSVHNCIEWPQTPKPVQTPKRPFSSATYLQEMLYQVCITCGCQLNLREFKPLNFLELGVCPCAHQLSRCPRCFSDFWDILTQILFLYLTTDRASSTLTLCRTPSHPNAGQQLPDTPANTFSI